jgi:hypothetical protein
MAGKLWFEFFPDEGVEAELNGSLERLGTDWIDVVYCASPPKGLSVPDLVASLDALVAKGKLRAWGGLNWSPELLMEVHRFATEGLTPPTAIQLPHNVLDRGFVEGPRPGGPWKPRGWRWSPPTAWPAACSPANIAGPARPAAMAPNGSRSCGSGASSTRSLGSPGRRARRHRRPAVPGLQPVAPVGGQCLLRGQKHTAQLAEDLGTLAVAGRLGPAISRLEADTGQPDRHRD